MKKLLIIALVLSVLSLAAISVNSKWKSVQTPRLVLLDSAQVFDLERVKKVKPTDASLAEAARLYLMAEWDTAILSQTGTYLLSLRTFPLSDAYFRYSYALNHINDDHDYGMLRDYADSLRHNVTTREYISAAKYALDRKDTSVTIALLNWGMSNDTLAYKSVDKDEVFRPLENYPDYYYMMDRHVQVDSVLAYHSSLRTMRMTTPAALPYTLTDEVLNKTFLSGYDTTVTPHRYIPGYTMVDDAMGDVIRENRFGRFSRFTDHSVQYVATLHLSDRFYSYIYSTAADLNENEMMAEVAVDDSGRVIEPPKDVRQSEPYDSPNEIFLVTIDKYGKKIATQQIGCRRSPLHISLSSIDRTGLIEIKDIEQKWELDPVVSGYKNNKVISRNVTAVNRYKVTAKGEIVATTDGATAQ
jgi:hypothetical protein